MKNKIYLLSASLMVATFSFFSCVSSEGKETGKDEIEKKGRESVREDDTSGENRPNEPAESVW